MSDTTLSTREEWLTWAASLLAQKLFIPRGFDIDLTNVRYSSGFPLGSRGSNKHLGQCLDPSVSGTGLTEIYISPTVSDSSNVLGVLQHELVHHYVGLAEGHGKRFGQVARRTGLEGPNTATIPGSRARTQYTFIIGEIGSYPHSEVTIPVYGSKGSNLIKAQCPTCNYTVRLTSRWLRVAIPICPSHMTDMTIEERKNV